MTFVVAHFTYEHTKNKFLLFLGVGYFMMAFYGLINIVLYDSGISIINGNNLQAHSSLWLFSQIFEITIILVAIKFLDNSTEDFPAKSVFIINGIIFLIFMLISQKLNITEHIKEIKILDLVALLVAIYLFQKKRDLFKNDSIYNIFFFAIISATLSQFSLIFSQSLTDNWSFLGVIFKFISFWFIFYGAVISGLDKPFRLMADKRGVRRLEKLLQQDEELISLYENVFTNTNNGILVTDSKNRIIRINRAFSKITEFSNDDVYGKRPSILKSGRQSKDFYEEMWKSLQENGFWEGEIWNKKKFGVIYPQWLSINVIRDESGNVKNYISSFSDISIIKESQDALEYMAHHDNLTGLVNRVLLKALLDNAIKSRKRENGVGALLYLDLDKFKYVNDTYGHGAGDNLLQQVAKRLTSSVRSSDIVARVGGDEFIVLLTKIGSKDDVKFVAMKIISEISRAFNNIVEEPIYIGTSIGGTIFPDQSEDVEVLVKNADIAMFVSKNGGRNRYTFYSDNMESDIVEKANIERDLRTAIIGDEFVLYYQPQIDANTQKLLSAEALIRWKHPLLGLMPPMKFINIAEESELIIEIGKWVIYQACKQMGIWEKKGIEIGKISVNVSTVQFMKSDMIESVKSIIKKSGCNPKKLEIEITERVLIENHDVMFETLSELGKLGIEFAIDDFGTGYSSLSRLRKLPFNTIKIDRSFVMETPHNKDDVAITKSVIALGKSFNYKVVAEGVETEEQLLFLKDLKCDIIQGFYYAQPMSPEDFEKFYFQMLEKQD
jgi:diguanylate cyclase (GGDEF)-like protein/PAS domain S-box-containing protein